jgi:putative ABC transport system ATP-binding protein
VQDLRFAWSPDSPAVLDLAMIELAAGERVFVEGPSGSGKSTLLSLLAGVLLPQRGRVEVLDQPLSALGPAARDRFRSDHIGFIFQLFNLIPYLSVVDNVTLPCRFSSLRRRRALERAEGLEAGARELLAHLDLDDPALRARAVTELSVGQQQRVAAARALMGAPELVIADEPTSSLDAARREGFIRLLFEECARSGATLVFVSHDTALASMFDRRVSLPQLNRVGQG